MKPGLSRSHLASDPLDFRGAEAGALPGMRRAAAKGPGQVDH